MKPKLNGLKNILLKMLKNYRSLSLLKNFYFLKNYFFTNLIKLESKASKVAAISEDID